MDFLADINNAVPEAALAGFGLVALLLGAIGGDRISGLLRLLSAAALVVAAVLTFHQFQHPGAADGIAAFASPMAPDGLYRVTMFTLFAKTLTYALAALALFMSGGFLKTAHMERYEYPLLIVFDEATSAALLNVPESD